MVAYCAVRCNRFQFTLLMETSLQTVELVPPVHTRPHLTPTGLHVRCSKLKESAPWRQRSAEARTPKCG
jgi:hypothetical protein